MPETKIIEFKSRRQRDIEEIVTEVQRLEASGQFSSETADLVGFVSTQRKKAFLASGEALLERSDKRVCQAKRGKGGSPLEK